MMFIQSYKTQLWSSLIRVVLMKFWEEKNNIIFQDKENPLGMSLAVFHALFWYKNLQPLQVYS